MGVSSCFSAPRGSMWPPTVFAMLRAWARRLFDAYAAAYKRSTFATEARAHGGRRPGSRVVREAYCVG